MYYIHNTIVTLLVFPIVPTHVLIGYRVMGTARNAKDAVVQKAWDVEEGAKNKVAGVVGGAVEGIKETAKNAKDAVVDKARDLTNTTESKDTTQDIKNKVTEVKDRAMEKGYELKNRVQEKGQEVKD